MDQVKSTIQLQNYSVGNQSSFVSIQEDGSTCLKHVVGYASPKLTPKHTRSVKQSKRKTKTHESPHLEFPPPPAFPPPELYDLSDEYSPDLIDNDVPDCKADYSLNDNLVSFRANGDDQPPEGFWNSPVEAPWSYFMAGGEKKKVNEEWNYDGRGTDKVTDLDEPNEFWESQVPEEGWILKNIESSTPYMERKSKIKRKSKKNKMKEEEENMSEEIMLINKLKEDIGTEKRKSEDKQNFRNEIWVSSAPANEDGSVYQGINQDNSTIQIKKNHISNVLITHGNDEILDNFIENKPINNGNNVKKDDNYGVHLVSGYSAKDGEEVRSSVVGEKKENSELKNNITIVASDPNCRPDYRINSLPVKGKRIYTQGGRMPDMSPMGNPPDEYSYAYYEPGPVNKVIRSQDPKYDRNLRHTYTTRYGTEENIYEEITEVGSNFKNRYYESNCPKKMNKVEHYRHGSMDSAERQLRNHVCNGRKSQSQISLNQSIVEEEVREVQSTHRRVLGQLNLTMEEMLMPATLKEKDGFKDEIENKKEDGVDDHHINQVTDLDSGFSGSSGTSASFYGGSNYVKSTAPFRRPDVHRTSLNSTSKIYPQMLYKNKQHVDMMDYRGGGCCGDRCCGAQAQYLYSGRMMGVDNGIAYQQSPCHAYCTQNIPNFQCKNMMSMHSLDSPYRKNLNSSVKSLSFPRGTSAPTSASFSKKSTGSGSGSSWAKRGWKRLTGLAIGSTNKVNVLEKVNESYLASP